MVNPIPINFLENCFDFDGDPPPPDQILLLPNVDVCPKLELTRCSGELLLEMTRHSNARQNEGVHNILIFKHF